MPRKTLKRQRKQRGGDDNKDIQTIYKCFLILSAFFRIVRYDINDIEDETKKQELLNIKFEDLKLHYKDFVSTSYAISQSIYIPTLEENRRLHNSSPKTYIFLFTETHFPELTRDKSQLNIDNKKFKKFIKEMDDTVWPDLDRINKKFDFVDQSLINLIDNNKYRFLHATTFENLPLVAGLEYTPVDELLDYHGRREYERLRDQGKTPVDELRDYMRRYYLTQAEYKKKPIVTHTDDTTFPYKESILLPTASASWVRGGTRKKQIHKKPRKKQNRQKTI